MTHLLLTTIAAVLLVGCGESQQSASGADVNAKDRYGATPLLYAAKKEIAELLITKGADVNAKNSQGWTLLQKAVLNGHKEIAQLLIANGADVNAKNLDFGDGTPLDYAGGEIADLLRKHRGKTGGELTNKSYFNHSLQNK
jgi:ankyrin repeat protein